MIHYYKEDKCDAMHSNYNTDNISQKDLKKIFIKAFRNIYRHLKRLLKDIFDKEYYGRPNLKRIIDVLKVLKIDYRNA